MGDHSYDMNQNSKIITLSHDDVMVHHTDEPKDQITMQNGDILTKAGEDDLVERIKSLDFQSDLERDKGDDTSTTSSGVSSGGSASLSSSTTSPSKNGDKKKFDVSLNAWNIWQEDITYEPRSDSEDEDPLASFRKFREVKSADADSKKKRFSFLKRLSLRDSHTINVAPKESIPLKTKSATSLVGDKKEIKVETLPQYFVVKYLGCRRSSGLYGLKHIRGPVDEMIEAVGHMKKNEELTLAQLHVTKRGVHMSAHNDNKGPEIPTEFIPIEFLSYGVQDYVHTRVFCLIIVRTMARHAKKMECHAFVCNCSATAKKLALSVALAFERYAESLRGKPYRFEVDLKKKDKPKAVGDAKSEFEA